MNKVQLVLLDAFDVQTLRTVRNALITLALIPIAFIFCGFESTDKRAIFGSVLLIAGASIFYAMTLKLSYPIVILLGLGILYAPLAFYYVSPPAQSDDGSGTTRMVVITVWVITFAAYMYLTVRTVHIVNRMLNRG